MNRILEMFETDTSMVLPNICWHSSKTNAPRPMRKHTGIVLHKISGKNLFPEDPFNLDEIIKQIMVPYRVSYHIVITRQGDIRVWVPFEYQAFHAGLSRYKREEYCNSFMMGIGLLSTGLGHHGEPAFTPIQVKACAAVSAELMRGYEIQQDAVTSHEFIRNNWNKHNPDKPGSSRAGDPGALWPWNGYRRLLTEALAV